MDKDFYQQIFDLVKLIPKGRICTYGIIAKSLGTPQASRVVGYAMNKSRLKDSTIPAHRVVNRNGMLTGKHHFAHPKEMQESLEAEGHRIIDDKIQDFEEKIWDPMKELWGQ